MPPFECRLFATDDGVKKKAEKIHPYRSSTRRRARIFDVEPVAKFGRRRFLRDRYELYARVYVHEYADDVVARRERI